MTVLQMNSNALLNAMPLIIIAQRKSYGKTAELNELEPLAVKCQREIFGWIYADDAAKTDMYEKLYVLESKKNKGYVYCNYEFIT